MILLDEDNIKIENACEVKLELRKLFEEKLKKVPFIHDELLRKNPRFTLEFNESQDRYKFVIVQSMYELVEDLVLDNVMLIEHISTIANSKLKEQEDLSILSEEYSTTEINPIDIVPDGSNDEAIILKFGEFHGTLKEGAMGKKIKVYALMEVYYDRWAAPENLGKILFYSHEEASKYIKAYVNKHHTLKFVPDEYRGLESLGYQEYYVKELRVAPSSENLNFNAMVPIE